MNLAFPAFILTLLVLPGILFWFAFRRGTDLRSPVAIAGISEELAWGIVWCIPIHLLATIPVGWCGLEVYYDTLLRLLSGTSEPTQFNELVRDVRLYSKQITFYFLAVNFGALFIGVGLHSALSISRLDRVFKILRFPNEWKYLFEGKIERFGVEGFRYEALKKIYGRLPDYIYVYAVVAEAGKAVLVSGLIDDYFFNSQGDLDRIQLSDAKWTPMQINWEYQDYQLSRAVGKDYKITDDKRDKLLIKYSEILNLKVEYKILKPPTNAKSKKENAGPPKIHRFTVGGYKIDISKKGLVSPKAEGAPSA